ncbi:uncharacterized protein LOC127843943 [Dreissena polymorpha]|uniref:uncharacterized protein LOC127843943 n=1 Tax=Dreissena polymorpha TaxID=45954 RepID=UPI002265659D|nr:uncharacterized protein LOC127843943 [Dreissena polymorpha]
MRLLLFIAVLWKFSVHKALTCLTCDDVVQPRHCTMVMTCPDNEVCFVERRVNSFGEEGYTLGCMRDQVCRNLTSTSPNSRCSQCCSKDLCNHEGCGEPGYLDIRGPVCYNCIAGVPEGRCHHIDICRPGEICSVSGKGMFGTTVFASKCMQKDTCGTHLEYGLEIIGKRGHLSGSGVRSYDVHDCIQCCTADLCNKNCHNSVDGQWGSWGSWSSCNARCNQTRSRPCNNPAPEHGGRNCDGNSTQIQSCVDTCQVDGQWGSWGSWSSCNSRCNQTRSRPCNNPAPKHGGRNCAGNSTQTQNCVDNCQVSDCYELHNIDPTLSSGVYTIIIPLSHTPIQVYCDMETDGGGWTVFQRRFNGSVDFYRNFSDYENGFGFVSGEHWLGLKYIHEIASQGVNQFRLDIVRYNGSKGFDVYGNFGLKPGPFYVFLIGARLRFSGCKSLLATVHGSPNGASFSTFDQDADGYVGGNCAVFDHSGWWHNDCSTLNPNGLYLPGQTNDDVMRYAGEEGLKSTTLMFKPI